MKKYQKSARFKKFNKRHAAKLNKRRLISKKKKKQLNQFGTNIPKEVYQRRKKIREIKKKYNEVVPAPTNFSFIDNSEEIIEFVKKCQRCFDEKKTVFIELKSVKNVTYDAIILLLSIMYPFKLNSIKFDGDFPEDPKANAKIRESGFLGKLISKVDPANEIYELANKDNNILTHAQKKVDAALGKQVIEAASKTIWGNVRRCQGVQRVILELMQNTNNHAILNKNGEKHWWLSVNHVKEEKRVCFSFIDYGIGVFQSLSNKGKDSKWYDWKNIIRRAKSRMQSNSDILRLILDGELHRTVTREHYRGKGLPGIKVALQRNQISNLYIITNDVFADVTNNIYKQINNNFIGTFIYWELNENSWSCP